MHKLNGFHLLAGRARGRAAQLLQVSLIVAPALSTTPTNMKP